MPRSSIPCSELHGRSGANEIGSPGSEWTPQENTAIDWSAAAVTVLGSVSATSLNALSFDLEDWYQVLYFGGGGYFRLLPYRAVRWALRRINRAGIPGVVYIHPWELDPGHPVVPVRRSHRFQHYVNLKRTEAKLRRLLTDFRFVPMGELYAAVRGSLH